MNSSRHLLSEIIDYHSWLTTHGEAVLEQLSKCVLTIGSGRGSGTSSKYAVYLYTKHCKCGELIYHEDDPYRVAEYLIYFCGYQHLKDNLPLRQYS